MVASDRKLGGFAGQWGPGNPKVERKRSILQSEGVIIGADGRIDKRCILYDLKEATLTRSPIALEPNRLKRQHGATDADCASPVKRRPVAQAENPSRDVTSRAEIKRTLAQLLVERGPSKTC